MKKFSFLIVLLILFSGGFFAWWFNGNRPADPGNKTIKNFTILQGEGVRNVAKDLKKQGLIRDEVIFFLVVKRLGLESKIQAGEFFLSPSMNATEIARSLQTGTSDMQIVIPEGFRADEIADVLEKKSVNYDESWRREMRLYEGYLFPDTYFFPKDAGIELIIETMRDNFDSKYQSLNTSNTSYSQEEIVTLASLIEREARHSEDRPLVASVIHNRLDIGMALQIDATVQYVLGYQEEEKRWWKRHLTRNDLSMSSPYNTYENPGLPPGPIANPGAEALNAALNPAETDYLYYISDQNGINRYAETFDQHNANIQKYGL